MPCYQSGTTFGPGQSTANVISQSHFVSQFLHFSATRSYSSALGHFDGVKASQEARKNGRKAERTAGLAVYKGETGTTGGTRARYGPAATAGSAAWGIWERCGEADSLVSGPSTNRSCRSYFRIAAHNYRLYLLHADQACDSPAPGKCCSSDRDGLERHKDEEQVGRDTARAFVTYPSGTYPPRCHLYH